MSEEVQELQQDDKTINQEEVEELLSDLTSTMED